MSWWRAAGPSSNGPSSAAAFLAAPPTMSPPAWSARCSASRCSAATVRRAPRRSSTILTTPAAKPSIFSPPPSRNDLYLSYVIITPQADRSKAWGEQQEDLVARLVDEDSAGITVRGAKMLGTATIMCNELSVANLQPLRPGEEDLALSFALPMATPGLKILSRKSFEAHAVSRADNPLSARFDENDAILWFEDVKVPW